MSDAVECRDCPDRDGFRPCGDCEDCGGYGPCADCVWLMLTEPTNLLAHDIPEEWFA